MAESFARRQPFFSVITPSYNMLRFLPSCCNSVSDQEGVTYEHIVVDAGSIDGTVEWLKSHPSVISIDESDDGMYDAINKGIRMSNGEIVSYLNCDEQYLPGALQRVEAIFRGNPEIDMLFGNTLIIRPDGRLLSYRKGFVPRWIYIWASHMYVHTSSMFIRRRVFSSGLVFDKSWKTIGDADFVIKALRKGFRARHIGEYFSAFAITDTNLGDSEIARTELAEFRAKAPWWLRNLNFITHTLVRLEKLWHGAYWEKMPLSYSVYTTNDRTVRSDFVCMSVSPLYPRKG